MTSLFREDDVVFVGHFSEAEERGFLEVAGRYRDRYTFAKSVDDLGGEGGRVECYHIPDQVQKTLSWAEMERDARAMERFIEGCGRGLVPELTRRLEGRVYEVCLSPFLRCSSHEGKADNVTRAKSGKPLLHYLHHTPDQRPWYRNFIRPLARKYSGHVQFLTTNIPEYGGTDAVAGIFGLEPERIAGQHRTAMVLQDLRMGRVFVYEVEREGGVMDVGSVERWLVRVLGGEGDGGRGGKDEL